MIIILKYVNYLKIKMFKILLINGPNLNLLGIREPKQYGNKKLSDIIPDLNKYSQSLNILLDHLQSNSECDIINCIHDNYKSKHLIIINPAALTHTSIALRDAFLSIKIPFIEIHLSNIYKREKFRHRSYLSDIAIGVIYGFGIDGYYASIQMAHKYLSRYL